MIKEAYVSFEVAKLLKEKGFPQDYDVYHSMVYNEEDYEDEYEVQRMVLETKLVKAGTLSSYPIGVPEPKCYAPTHQMAMAWLRTKPIIIVVQPEYFNADGICSYWGVDIWADDNYEKLQGDFPSYEEAVEAALKYSLENLI